MPEQVKIVELEKAIARLRTVAGRRFPDLTGWDIGKVSIAARLRAVDIHPSDAMEFVRKLINDDEAVMKVVHGLYDEYQYKVVEAAFMAGIAIGAQAERMRNARTD